MKTDKEKTVDWFNLYISMYFFNRRESNLYETQMTLGEFLVEVLKDLSPDYLIPYLSTPNEAFTKKK